MKPAEAVRRPEWLRIRLRSTEEFAEVRRMMDGLSLTTVCEEARCPNIYECWSNRTATFMILGEVCTRQCGFCAVTSGLPPALPDPDEPRRIAQAVKDLGLAHAVITSVDRDDLPDGGARHFASVIEAIHAANPGCAAEVLTPDFKGAPGALATVLSARPEVFSHNTETVRRLYKQARPGSRYDGSLALLRAAAELRDAWAAQLAAAATPSAGTAAQLAAAATPSAGTVAQLAAAATPSAGTAAHAAAAIPSAGTASPGAGPIHPAAPSAGTASPGAGTILPAAPSAGTASPGAGTIHPAAPIAVGLTPYRFRVKTGLMAGLGETDEELKETFRDIRAAGVEVLTLGQYLQPTKEHLPVDRYVTPAQFDALREYALSLGFLHVVAGPLVRSSYHAHEHRPDPQPLHILEG